MLTMTTSVDEIDALIKNMEYLAPQHSERIKQNQIEEIKSLLENKSMLDFVQKVAGKDWEDDTRSLIKKIDKKYKIQQFTDIYINSLRCLLIYKAINDVTSSCTLELTKEYGDWIFNARYQGENHVVKWFDIKVSRYFNKTDLPKKFIGIMNGNPSYPITKEWVLKNQHFFFMPTIFNDYHVLLQEFIIKLEKEEQTPELDAAKNIPQDDDAELDGIPTVSSNTLTLVNKEEKTTLTVTTTPSAIATVHANFNKKLVQIGVDIAGDPIMGEEPELEEQVSVETINNTQEVIKLKTLENSTEENAHKNEKVSEIALNQVETALRIEPLPWEDDIVEIANKTPEKVDLPKPIPKEEKVVVANITAVKPSSTVGKPGSFPKPGSFSKPGSGFSKPGATLVSNYNDEYDDGYDAIKETPDNEYVTSKSNSNSKPDLFDADDMPDENDGFHMRNELNAAVFTAEVDFDAVLEDEKKKEVLHKEETVIEPYVVTDKLFENGMTYSANKEQELQKQKDEEIKRLEESIKLKEKEDQERIIRSGLGKNKVFMSLKNKGSEENDLF